MAAWRFLLSGGISSISAGGQFFSLSSGHARTDLYPVLHHPERKSLGSPPTQPPGGRVWLLLALPSSVVEGERGSGTKVSRQVDHWTEGVPCTNLHLTDSGDYRAMLCP